MTRLLVSFLVVLLSSCLGDDGKPVLPGPTSPSSPPPPNGSSEPFFSLSVAGWSGTQGNVALAAGEELVVRVRIERFNKHTSPIDLELQFDPHPELSTSDPAVSYEVPCHGAARCCGSGACLTRVPQNVDEVPLTIKATSLARFEMHQIEIRGTSAVWNRGAPLMLWAQVGPPRSYTLPDAGGLPTLAAWRHLTRIDGGITAMSFSTPREVTAEAQVRLITEARRASFESGNPFTQSFDLSVPSQSFVPMSDPVGLLAEERATSAASTFASDGRFYVARMHVRFNVVRFRLDRAEPGSTELNLVTDGLLSASDVYSVGEVSMAAGPNGTIDLAWREYRQTPTGAMSRMLARRIDPTNPNGVPAPLVLSGRILERAVVVGGPTLRLVSVESGSWSTPHIFLDEQAPGGGPLLARVTLEEALPTGGSSVSAAAAANGDVYVAYRTTVNVATSTTEKLVVKRVSGTTVTDLTPAIPDFGTGSISRTSIIATHDGLVFAAYCSGYAGRAFVAKLDGSSWTAMTDGDPSPEWVADVQLGYASFGPRRVLFRAMRVEDFYRRGALDGVHLHAWSLR